MSTLRPATRARGHRISWALASLAAAAFVFLVLGISRAGAPRVPSFTTRHSGMAMDDAAMKRHAAAYWAAHAPVGQSSTQAPAATFTIGNFFFDNDGNTATQVDTAKILLGQSVMWQWIAGDHTITNGTGFADPNAGTLFNQPSNMTNTQFTFTFSSIGTVPFFCRFHELENMRGVVVVREPTGVEPSPPHDVGFTAAPSPNPTPAGVSFRFALRQGGPVRAEVFDARGRSIAVVLDRELDAGDHAATWNGRGRSNTPARPGIYYLRLSVPGSTDSRPIVIAR